MCTPSMSYRFTTSLSTAMKWSLGRRLTRIEPQVLAVLAHDLGVRDARMIGRRRTLRAGHPHAIRIEPDVQLQPAPMRLLDRELERIVKRLGRLAHSARKKLRPRLQLRRVQRIGLRAGSERSPR